MTVDDLRRDHGDRGAGGGAGDPASIGGEPVLPPLGTVGWARWAWRQLTSMRTALLLLVLLAVAAVPGSMLPQRRSDPGAVADYLNDHPTLGPWLDRLGGFDVFTSPWFSAIYLLLFVSLVGCVLPRSRVHLRALRSRPPAPPSRLNRMPAYLSVPLTRPGVGGATDPGAAAGTDADADAERVLAAAHEVLRRRRYRTVRYAGAVSAERGHLAETGNLVFHLALVGLLGALAWGSLATYSGQVTVVEGRTFANVVTSYDAFSAGPLVDTGALPPFTARLDRLDVAFESSTSSGQLGAPRRFEATMTVRDTPDAPARRVRVQPNHPLDVGGTRAFLVGNGYAPVITVRDGNGDVAFRGPVITRPQDGTYKSVMVVKVPDAQPRQIGLAGVFLPTYDLEDGVPVSLFPDALNPRVMLLAFVAEPGQDGLNVNSGVAQSVFRLDTRRMTQLTGPDGAPLRVLIQPGGTARLPDDAGSVSFDGYARFAALDVRRDPSRSWALAFASLALAGVTASLFVRRRRLWVRPVTGPDAAADGAGTTVVEVAGLARGDDPSLPEEVATVAEQVSRQIGRQPGERRGTTTR